MSRTATLLLLAIAGGLLSCSGEANAQSTLRVYVTPNEPFVRTVTNPYDGATVLSGFDIDMWDRMYDLLRLGNANLTFSYVLVPSFAELYARVDADPNGIGLSGVAVTAAAIGTFAVSPAYFQTGSDIVVERIPPASNVLLIFTPLDWKIWISGVALLYFSGHVFWFFERNINPKKFPKSYLRGVNAGVWYAWGTLTFTKTYDIHGFATRMYSVGWSSLCIIYVAAYTANLMSILLVQQLKSQVNYVSDVNRAGRSVGVIVGSPGAEWAARFMREATLVPFASVDLAWSALTRSRVSAVIYDGAVLQFILNTRSFDKRFELLNQRVTSEVYAVIANKAMPLMDAINGLLLDMSEDGFLTQLRAVWFIRKFVPTPLFVEQQLTLQAFAGMFLVAALAFAISVCTHCYLSCRHVC